MPTTVLFVHGLESGPHGRKRRILEQAGFTVVAGQMPCGQRAVLRDAFVVAVIAGMVAGTVAATGALGMGGLAVGIGASAVAWWALRPAVMRRTFRKSVDVQLALLQANAIDVVVGSSFGGAVTIELLGRGAWKGPTLLLCPAHRLVAERSRRPTPTLPAGAKVVVVHGRQDETVPVQHSEELVRGTASPLVLVDDDHPLSATATPENLATWVALALGGASDHRAATGWELENVEEAARQSATFFIPSEEERVSLQVGDTVRVHFVLLERGPDDPRAERMWVEVVAVLEPGRYRGCLTNQPEYIGALREGDDLDFGSEHVAAVLVPTDDPRWYANAERQAVVSQSVFDDCCRWLYRELPDGPEDSGWRLFSGKERADELEDISRIRLCNVAWLCDLDPTLTPLLRREDRVAFERPEKGAAWVQVQDWVPPGDD